MKQNLQTLWLEGSNSWATNMLVFNTADPQRRHLLAAINRHPATLEQLVANLGLDPGQITNITQALERAKLIRKDSDGRYAPTFPILTTDDLNMLLPRMQPVLDQYCRLVQDLAPKLDQLMADLNLDSRMPVFLGFARDEMAYGEMKRRGLIPADGTKFIADLECIYAAEPFPPLDSNYRPGLIFSASGEYRLLYIRDNFRHRHLFTRWGFEYQSQATPALASIIDCLATPTTVGRLAQILHDEEIPGLHHLVEQGHLPSVLNYLAEQGWVSWQNHWQATPAVITGDTIRQLAELVKPASDIIADLVQDPGLDALYPQTSPGRHKISISHFRAAVAWKTIWTATGLLTEQGFFPEENRELYIFRME